MISVKGNKESCGNLSNCKAGGGAGGIVQIISRSGFLAPHVISLTGQSRGHRDAPENGFLYIKGEENRSTQ